MGGNCEVVNFHLLRVSRGASNGGGDSNICFSLGWARALVDSWLSLLGMVPPVVAVWM